MVSQDTFAELKKKHNKLLQDVAKWDEEFKEIKRRIDLTAEKIKEYNCKYNKDI